jgi:23S rRNA (cytosine1962-C5)-methyltransferase
LNVTSQPDTPTGRVRLVRGRERTVLAGYLWVYAGHVEEVAGEPAPGDVVDVCARSGRFIGRGFFNPQSKIRVRLLSFRDKPIDESFWASRIADAAALRRRVVSGTTAHRLIHGESDLLPGLIVDRYADTLVMQALSYGMARRKDFLADLLMRETGASSVYLRNDVHSLALEGLPVEQRFLRGDGPTAIDIAEGTARFTVDIEHGQKTGWFCDQRENRLAATSLAKGAAVLEAFCHTGAFGIQAALNGAQSVLGLDVSRDAVAQARAHAAMNEVGDRCEYREGDAFEELRRLERAAGRFDLVILDPPSFARTKQAVPQALAGYKQINLRAMKLVRPQGFLATCSCSHHVGEEEFWRMLQEAARDARRPVRLLERRSQARDHPVLAAMPETRYLKCLILQML